MRYLLTSTKRDRICCAAEPMRGLRALRGLSQPYYTRDSSPSHVRVTETNPANPANPAEEGLHKNPGLSAASNPRLTFLASLALSEGLSR